VITITVNSNVADGLREERDRLHAAIVMGVTKATIGVQTDVIQNKLHGQVLNQRTGNLARNTIALPVEDSGDIVVGTVGVGSTAWYGKVHEFGTTDSYDIYPVRAKALAWMGFGGMVFAKHVVHPPFKERSFLRSSLRELTDNGKIKEWIEGPILEALGG
jgi:hypothetical protein